MKNRLTTLALVCVFALMARLTLQAAPTLKTESWEDNDAAFAAFAARIQSSHNRNLLARDDVHAVMDPHSAIPDAGMLIDGDAGTRGDRGRVFVDGQPSVITFFLGTPKTIKEVGAYSFNGDARSNQDYEVRFASGGPAPGVVPDFPEKAQLTTGDRIVGNDHGGFHTRFVDEHGGPLVQGKYDWIQFRIWRTYGVKAGHAARTGDPSSGTAMVELEVLGDDRDVAPPTPEQQAYVKAAKAALGQPEWVQRPTWRESLTATREELLQWECLQDHLALYKAGVALGPWHLLGPVPQGGKVAQQIQSADRLDLTARYADEHGKQFAWQKCEKFADAQVNDLSTYGKEGVIFLCRSLNMRRAWPPREVYLDLAADGGSAWWLPGHHGPGIESSLPILRGGSNMMREEAQRQFVMQLSAGGDGQRRFCFTLKPNLASPGAGSIDQRWQWRYQFCEQARAKFTDPIDQLQMRWEMDGGIWLGEHGTLADWAPGCLDDYMKLKYRAGIERRLSQLDTLLREKTGVQAMALASVQEQLADWSRSLRQSLAPSLSLDTLRAKYYRLAAVKEAGDLAGRVRSLRLAVEDQRSTLGDRYPKGDVYLARVDVLEKAAAAVVASALSSSGSLPANLVALKTELDKASAEVLLANPLLDFDKLLVVRGTPYFQSNWDGPNHLGSDLIVVSPVRADGKQTLLYHDGRIADFDLNWDGRRILFSNGNALFEIQADGTGLRQVSAKDPPVWHYDGCYLPDGKIACVSNACEQAVPCTGGPNVGNMHILNADGSGDHRVCFEQDQDWNPTVMQDGRILYTRWEYADLPHYFSRLLFRMNPDGSGQMEYYHSNSYWPNAMFWPRPIPGHPTEIVCVISGHHGVSRTGEMVLLDPALGRHEAQGCLQRIPGYGKKVEAIIEDQLVTNSWPKFACPWPLAEPKTNRGAGKYFLASVKPDESATWDLCLVDIFDNITPILKGGYMNGVPLRPREKPPVIPSNLTAGQKDGVILLADIYRGEGLRGYPRGSIKQLRIGSYEYRFAGNGDTYAASNEGGWDVKKILGTVPVREDGSAMFRVPANTPIFVQPLDAEGKAQQIMRSWYTAMPGETASCVGCHENQNSGPPSKMTAAALARPAEITPWNGPTRGFSFDREVQPVLDRRCVGCHEGKPVREGDRMVATPDLRAKQLRPDFSGRYSPAYMVLQEYVRRAGFESDIHMHVPSEFEADTSPLVQMLKKGHHNVQLTRDDWERLYTWIDFNVPYPANWRESHVPPSQELVERRAKHQKLFAGIDDRDEEPQPLPPVAAFEPPAPVPASTAKPLAIAGWPLTADAAKKLQQATAAAMPPRELTLSGGIKMNFAVIPAGRFVMGSLRGAANESPEAAVTIDRPFYLGVTEVTNAQYAAFDPHHDSGYIEGRNKDRTSRGTPINAPDQPVVRVSWNEAMAFCRWLSQETGCRATLPTEAQWEWACRAGAATAFSFGDTLQDHNGAMNIADSSIAGWNYGRAEPNYSDGYYFTIPVGRTPANAWGLADMHGNAAEWCLSNYRPYPYDLRDGRDDPQVAGLKVVRGGSWNDLAKDASSSARWRYQPYQPVYNVGFRVLIEIGSDTVAKTAAAEHLPKNQ